MSFDQNSVALMCQSKHEYTKLQRRNFEQPSSTACVLARTKSRSAVSMQPLPLHFTEAWLCSV